MNRFVARLMVGIFLFCSSPSLYSQDSPGTPSPSTEALAPTQTGSNSSALPDSPGTAANSATAPNHTTPPSTATSTGAAAAPAPEVSGSVVSRPAGAAIAPPKQRQVRSFLIKMGLIAGVGAAVGTVAALSLASPARVPGSH